MRASVRDLIFVLETFFPGGLALERALYILAVVISIIPLWRLHVHQAAAPHQPRRTAWVGAIAKLIDQAFHPDDDVPDLGIGEGQEPQYADDMAENIGVLYELLGLDAVDALPQSIFTPSTRLILCTSRLDCVFCPPSVHGCTLRRRVDLQSVRVLDQSFKWIEAHLIIAQCPTCRSDYYPDRITYPDVDNSRIQRLECDATYLRISKHGVWAHRKVAVAQERALFRFHAGWSNFADWINESLAEDHKITYRQSQHLFVEHFSRRLLVAHNCDHQFSSPAHPSSSFLVEAVRDVIGRNGGAVRSAIKHACADCTHHKRYRINPPIVSPVVMWIHLM